MRTSAAAGAVLVGTGLIGCAQPGSPVPQPSTTATKQPKRGGVLTHMSGQETRGEDLDPHTDTPLKGETYRLMYQGLLDYHPETYEVMPQLAQKWEQPTEGTYLFTLQSNVKWQNKPPANGRALTVEDIVFNFNRVRTNEPRFTARSLLATIDKVEAVDRATIRITTKEPDAPLLSKLSGDNFLTLAPEVVERAGKFNTADVAVGTGPYILQSVEEKVGADFTRNPDYWKAGLPYLDRIRTRHLGTGSPGDQVAWAAFLAGELDTVVMPGTEAKKFTARPGGEFSLAYFKGTSTWWTTPNTKVKPFDDARVTKALRLLTDHYEFKTAWAETWFGKGRHGSFLPSSLDVWDFTDEEYARLPEWKQQKDDAAREAMTLLQAAGFNRDNVLRFELGGTGGATPYYQAAVELLQDQWRRLGQGVIQTELKLYDSAQYQAVRANRSFSYGAFSNLAGFNEPDAWLTQVYGTGGSRNYWNYSDAKLDGMIARQRVTFDNQQRKLLVKEAISHLIDIWPGSLGSNIYWPNAVKPHLQNFLPELWLHGSQYDQVWLDV